MYRTSYGYAHTCDLVQGLLEKHPIALFVAAYPETHPQAISADTDPENLMRAGFHRFLDRHSTSLLNR